MLIVLAGVAAPARAESGGALDLSIETCPSIDEARLRALVDIEIRTVAPVGAPPARVRLSCTGDRVAIDVAAGPTWPASRSAMNLADAAEETRPRLLALAITELVSLAWTSPPPAPSPAARAEAPSADVARTAPPPAGSPRFALGVGTSVRRMGSPGAWLAGLDVGVERALGSWAALGLDVRGETGEAEPAVARVGWRQLVVTGTLPVGVARGAWAVHALPGWSVGVAHLSARPVATDARGGTLTGVWSGPSLALRVRRALGRVAYASLEVGGGAVTRRVVGLRDGLAPIFEIDGAWALAGLTVGATF